MSETNPLDLGWPKASAHHNGDLDSSWTLSIMIMKRVSNNHAAEAKNQNQGRRIEFMIHRLRKGWRHVGTLSGCSEDDRVTHAREDSDASQSWHPRYAVRKWSKRGQAHEVSLNSRDTGMTREWRWTVMSTLREPIKEDNKQSKAVSMGASKGCEHLQRRRASSSLKQPANARNLIAIITGL